MKKITSYKIKNYWDKKALDTKSKSSEVTHKDIWQRWLEIELIKKYLRRSDRLLDVGCGNGYTALQISGLVKEIIGIDYSNEMINRATTELSNQPGHLKGVISFRLDNVLELDKSRLGMFDCVISERCLINLNSWEAQKKAITKISSVLRKGGRFIFVEGLKEGRDNLNKLRLKVGLKKMPKVWHNIDFEMSRTLKYLRKYYSLEDRLQFGVYDFISRVVHPLVVYPKDPKYEAKINEVAAKLAFNNQNFEEVSRVIFLVMKKK